MAMDRLFSLMAEKKASDVYLAPGSPVHIRINGVAIPVNQQPLDAAGVEALLREVLTERQWQSFLDRRELNVGYGIRGVGSYRINVFQQRGTPAAVVRYIPGEIPTLEALKLPTLLADLVVERRGLILVVGSTGSGKSTTLASMIDHRNTQRSGHILTFEDPIEFVFRNKRSIVNQRQIGSDTDSLAIGLKNAMRQAPDCILIGEIRDVETMTAAIAYAQSGHLVLATLHANNANNALNRIVSFYPPESRRVMLSDLAATMRAIVSQRLVRGKDGNRLPVVELLLNSRHVSELIEQGQLTEVKEAMEKSLAAGSQTFEQALLSLVKRKVISREDALANADSPTNLLWLLENAGLSDSGEQPSAKGGAATADAPQPALPATAKDADVSFSEFLLNI
jgi:twitching motility protein PilU